MTPWKNDTGSSGGPELRRLITLKLRIRGELVTIPKLKMGGKHHRKICEIWVVEQIDQKIGRVEGHDPHVPRKDQGTGAGVRAV